MSKVYIVAEVDYEYYNPIKIFETEETAQLYMKYREQESKLMDEVWEINDSMLDLFEEEKIPKEVYEENKEITEKIYKMLLGYSFHRFVIEPVEFCRDLEGECS